MSASSMHQSYDSHGYRFSRETVERALENHLKAGRIRSWRATGRWGLRYTRSYPMYEVTTVDGITISLATVHEAFAFTAGLGSATVFYEARDAAERAERLAEDQARQARLDAQHEREDSATRLIECETCGAAPGERCVRVPLDDTPYAAHPHATRLDRLNRHNDGKDLLSAGQAVVPR